MLRQPPPDPIYVLRGSGSPVTSLHFMSPSGHQEKPPLLAGTQEGKLFVYDMVRWRAAWVEQAHVNASLLSIHQCPSRPFSVLTQGRDGWVHVWDAADGATMTKTRSVPVTTSGFCAVSCFSLQNKDVMAVPTDKQSQVDVVCLESSRTLMTLAPTESSQAYGMCMGLLPLKSSTQPDSLLVGYEDGSIAAWDLRSRRQLSRLKLHDDTIMAFDYQPTLNKGVSASVDATLAVWRLSENGELEKVDTIQTTNAGFGAVHFRSDGKLLVTGGWDGRVRAFGAKKLRPLVVLDYHKETVQCLAFSDDSLLAAGGKDKHISFWSIYR